MDVGKTKPTYKPEVLQQIWLADDAQIVLPPHLHQPHRPHLYVLVRMRMYSYPHQHEFRITIDCPLPSPPADRVVGGRDATIGPTGCGILGHGLIKRFVLQML